MTPFEEHQLGARIAAQDTLIGILLGCVMSPEAVSAAALAAMIEGQAGAARKAGMVAQAAFLDVRAEVLRAL